MASHRANFGLLCAAAAFAFSPLASAADRSAMSEAQQRYQEERAACDNGYQDRTACLREAGAALQAARRGQLDEGGAAYERNRLARCGYLPAGEQPDCHRRMQGEGATLGSVEGGGIYRELTTLGPAPEREPSSPSTGPSARPLK